MASRSFKPASYLTSQPAMKPAMRSPRPSFARSSSASSTKSNNSEDSFVATLRTLSTTDNAPGRDRDSTSSLASGCHTPVNNPSFPRSAIDDTPGRKRSRPIAIELPSRAQPVYTPLTARGELKGGYFPCHETFSKSHKSNSVPKDEQETYDGQKSISRPSSPVNMSNASSTMTSPAEANRRSPPSVLTPAFAINLTVPEVLTMPMGKYHPSNYKAPASAPTLSPTNISLPPSIPDRKKKRPGHERHASDVKRKLQEYQMGQARNAAMLANLHGGRDGAVGFDHEPISPRLAPLGSPGPITPFELEDSAHAGYVVAGASRSLANEGLLGSGLEQENDRELVGRMIRAEEDRRVMGADEGSRSPNLRV